MTNQQCYCYGIIALNNIIKNDVPINSDTFYHELYYLWDFYSEEGIEKLYYTMERKRNIKDLEKRLEISIFLLVSLFFDYLF